MTNHPANKHLSSALAAVVLVMPIVLLAGCGGSGSTSTVTPPTETPTDVEGVSVPSSVSVVTAKNVDQVQ